MQKLNFGQAINKILLKDNRYDRDAYYFVREGLDYTMRMLKRNSQTGSRHVTGQELLEGLRRYALEQYGPMAKTVLAYWGVRRCEDFGEIVFRMVDEGILGKTEQDSIEDFRNGYDFDEAFVKPFQPAGRRRAAANARTRRARPCRRAARGSDAKKLSSGPN